MVLPTRTLVLPNLIASLKSPLIPMLNSTSLSSFLRAEATYKIIFKKSQKKKINKNKNLFATANKSNKIRLIFGSIGPPNGHQPPKIQIRALRREKNKPPSLFFLFLSAMPFLPSQQCGKQHLCTLQEEFHLWFPLRLC